MAYITIYRFRRNGYAAEHAWIANPWQGAIAIWQALEQRYLTPYIPEYIQRKWWYRPGMSREDLQKHLGSIPSRTGGISSVNAIQEIWDLVDNVYIELPYALEESGDLSQPLEAGRLKEENAILMSDYLAGERREIKEGETTYFKSVGMALFDICAANKLLEKAKEN